jgi:hypothetical protein
LSGVSPVPILADMWLLPALLACTDAGSGQLPVPCLGVSERAALSGYLASLDATRALAREGLSSERALGLLALPGVGLAGAVGIPLAPACGGGGTFGTACEGDTCWTATCNGPGWSASMESPALARGGWEATPQRGTTAWDVSGRFSWSLESRLRSPEGTDWSVIQRGVHEQEMLAVAAHFTQLRAGHEVVLRATLRPRGGAVGTVEVDGEPLAQVRGYGVEHAPGASCR